MSFFRRPLKAVFAIFSPTKSTAAESTLSQTKVKAGVKRSASNAFETTEDSKEHKGGKRRKSKSSQRDEESVLAPKAPPNDTTKPHERKLPASADRALMPPPSTAHIGHRKTASGHKAPRISLDLVESASQATKSSRAARSDVMDEYDMEEARRKAAATQLPPNSGIWETGERELFFHLSYRGFEPLLPNNWMIDFPTLPLPVFAHQESDIPLITCHRSTQFRSIRALRELLDTGTSIRDRTISCQNLRTEPILEKAVSKYIAWALKDVGYPDKPSRTTLPVHTIATLQPGQSTHDVIRRLASEMHILAAKHREAANIQTSVEQTAPERLTPPSSQVGPTQIHPERSDEEQTLPVIYGVMIASSILAIFTLNSHTPFPPFLVRTLLRNRQASLTPEKAAAINPHLPAQLQEISTGSKLTSDVIQGDEDSGIRYIANFDFSNASADVWNALVIAILAMQIRKTMGEVFNTWQGVRDFHKSQTSTDHRRDTMSEPSPDDHGDPGDVGPVGAIEDSWISNVDGDWGMPVPSSPVSGIDDLLSSPTRPVKYSKLQRKGKARAVIHDPDDPDA